MTTYRVRDTDHAGRPVGGIDYPPGKRAEPGALVDDLPKSSVGWLREAGIIEPARQAEEE